MEGSVVWTGPAIRYKAAMVNLLLVSLGGVTGPARHYLAGVGLGGAFVRRRGLG